MKQHASLFSLTGVLWLALMLGYGGSQPSMLTVVNIDSQASKKSSKEGAPIPVMTILDEYKRDSAAADKKYKGQTLLVSGTVETTGKSKKGIPFVGFQKPGAASPTGTMVVCSFNVKQADRVSTLKKGQEVKLKGRVQGELVGNVMLEDCVLQ